MHFLFIFLDGVGLGTSESSINPLVQARMPNLQVLLGGHKMVAESLVGGPLHSERASLAALDASLGVDGLPQSATGQAVLLTGVNVPAGLGYHYGPKPNPEVAAYLKNGNLFSSLKQRRLQAELLNAYPDSYFHAIHSGKRIYSAIPQAVVNAGIRLKTGEDLHAGQAITADFTAEGWHSHLKLPETPRLTPLQAGLRLAKLAKGNHFSMFEYWLSDYAGHQQKMEQACALLEVFDEELGGLLSAWDDQDGLILLTSDHGNLEDLTTRRHTLNPVPALVIGAPEMRRAFIHDLSDLVGITPKILGFFADNQRGPWDWPAHQPYSS